MSSPAVQRRAVLLALCVVATAFATVVTSYLPAKYFFDANEIEQLARGTWVPWADPSYTAPAQVYKLLGLQSSPVLVGVITMLIFIVAYMIATGGSRLAQAKPSTLVIAAITPFLMAIYVSIYSKEAMVLVASLILILLSKTRWPLIAMTVFALLYALHFRLYWGLVAVIVPSIAFLIWRRPTYRWLIVAMAFGVLVVAVVVAGEQHRTLTELRVSMNVGRPGSVDAVTLIPAYVSGGSYVGGYLNGLISLVLLLFPVPLLVLGTPQYVAAALFLALASITTGRATLRLARRVKSFPEDRVARSGMLCGYAAIALAVVQSAYVPDYGSALKHLTPILPLVIYALVVGDFVADRENAMPAQQPVGPAPGWEIPVPDVLALGRWRSVPARFR